MDDGSQSVGPSPSRLNVFCTLFDSNYLDKGLVLQGSLQRVADDYVLFVLPMDEACLQVLSELELANVVIIDPKHFEQQQGLAEIKGSRSRAEYCWTCTPHLLDYVFEMYGCDICTYLDADLCFYSNPESAIRGMLDAGKTVQVVEHGFSETRENRRAEAVSGRFCVEFNTFTSDVSARRVLARWKEQCREACSASCDNGVLGDQGYLDAWPELYDCVHVCDDFAVGVAPWNADRFIITREDSAVWVKELATGGSRRLCFYHFHNIMYVNRRTVNIRVFARFSRCDDSLIEAIYRPYLEELDAMKALLSERFGIETLILMHPAFEDQRESRTMSMAARVKKHLASGDLLESGLLKAKAIFKQWRNADKDIIVLSD